MRRINYAAKRPSAKWARHFGIEVIDHDGWRIDERTFEDRIDMFEFIFRYSLSTCKFKVGMTHKLDRLIREFMFWTRMSRIGITVPTYVLSGLEAHRRYYGSSLIGRGYCRNSSFVRSE